jgi:transposase
MQYNGNILEGGVSMRPHGSPKVLEERRRKAVQFLKEKMSLHEIARRVGCHASSGLHWRNALQSGGKGALKAKSASGRPPRLTAKQKAQRVSLLTEGAMAHGYRTQLGTTQRIAELIERRLEVEAFKTNPKGCNLISKSSSWLKNTMGSLCDQNVAWLPNTVSPRKSHTLGPIRFRLHF